MTTSPEKKKISELISELEEKVDRLRDGGDDLEESIRLYKQGMELAKQCEKRLKDARLEIEKIGIPDGDGQSEGADGEGAGDKSEDAEAGGGKSAGGLDI